MKAIIPAAGYATRLYPITEHMPKALLSIGSKRMVEHVVEKIVELGIVDEIIIVTNAKFFHQFDEWRKCYDCAVPIKVLNDGTTSNETRLGAIGDYYFAIRQEGIDDDVLFVSSDNLFNFPLKKMHEHFRKCGHDTIALYDVGTMDEAKKMGIAEINGERKVVGFVEKPPVPKSTLCSIGIYLYTKETVALFKKYLDDGNSPDKPGQFLEWLHKKKHVSAFVFDEPHHKWYDIGTVDTLEKVREEFHNGK